ncbi:MAG: hypothetical protein AMJ46_06480 [Latescibacteria bacterium DG_63]|nr:MAG: hypothetical protein AMJ46_06480 [Latescibacteria bacterium DG_63]
MASGFIRKAIIVLLLLGVVTTLFDGPVFEKEKSRTTACEQKTSSGGERDLFSTVVGCIHSVLSGGLSTPAFAGDLQGDVQGD